jgi:hypothetical protein
MASYWNFGMAALHHVHNDEFGMMNDEFTVRRNAKHADGASRGAPQFIIHHSSFIISR